MGDRAREIVQNFNFEAAANAMHVAIIKAIEKKQVKKIGVKQIVIVSLMRPSGTTGVQTHVNTFTAYLDSVSQPWQLVTPFSAPKLLLYLLLALRRLIEPIFPAAAVWLYREGHAWLLGLVLQRVLKLSPNAAIYAQCPVSANVALDKRQSVSQQVILVVHFNISQAEEWAGKGMITQHGPIYQWITDFEQRVIPQVDKLVFVSAYMQQQIQERIPAIAKVNQQVIPNFVADPMPQNQTDIDADLIAIGTLEPRKNQTYLLDIIAAAKALGKRITLTLVGDGPDRALLENKAKYLGISEQVYFKGFVPNGSSLIARHQACIHVAKIENLPVTLIEALAYAKPIFASAVGGVPELFDEGVHGRTIPLDNANEAAKIIVATLQNQTLVAQLGDAAWHHFASNFEQKLLGKRLCEFVLSFLKGDGCADSLKLLEQGQLKKRIVVIVQRCITIYRVPLFEQLKRLLEQEGIELRLLYGDATKAEQTKRDTVDIAWGEKLATRYLWDNRICWQPFFSKVQGADLVIVTQENKLVCNLWPLFGWRKYKLAFWGHGENMQALPTLRGKFKEHMKFLSTNRVDWWFVYTGISQQLVSGLGFSKAKITNLENSVDTLGLRALCDAVTAEEIQALRESLGLGAGPVGLYIGSLYQDKRLDFLLQAGLELSKKIPDFRLVVIGDGPQKPLIEKAQAEYPWLRYVGRQVERQKAQYLKMANVFLNPGLVGLGIMDAFAAGIPIVTTDCGLHSPEIDYLRQGENGFMTANTLEDYVETVRKILTDATLASHLQKGCVEAANHYTIENMAENFRVGILKALG